MARAVILSFKDNDAADTFVRIHNEVQSGNVSAPVHIAFNEMGLILMAHSNLEGVVAQPTLGCRCPNPEYGKAAWMRTKRFGWFVHKKCNRPSVLVVRNFFKNMIIASGNNLLPEILTTKEQDGQVVAPYQPPNAWIGSSTSSVPSVLGTSEAPRELVATKLDGGDNDRNVPDLSPAGSVDGAKQHTGDAQQEVGGTTTASPVDPETSGPRGAEGVPTTEYGEWQRAVDCPVMHSHGEPGWRYAPEFGSHEHWVPDGTEIFTPGGELVIRDHYGPAEQ